jgi:hypothetical protein
MRHIPHDSKAELMLRAGWSDSFVCRLFARNLADSTEGIRVPTNQAILITNQSESECESSSVEIWSSLHRVESVAIQRNFSSILTLH